MASFSGPKISNRIADDVPAIQALLSSLAKLTPDSGNTDYPTGTKHVTETTNGWEFQQYNGSSWVTLEKWNINAQKVDGYSAATGTTASTIPVRDANGKLPGDITGNAATASKAAALSAANPVNMGGTGGTTAEQARQNLGVAPTSHASSGTGYGIGTEGQYGHTKPHDAPDATLTAAGGHAFSPAGAAALQDTLEGQIGDLAGVVSGNAAAQAAKDAAQDTAIAGKLDKSGGTVQGQLLVSNCTDFIKRDVNNDRLTIWGGDFWQYCSYLELFGGDNTGRVQLNARDRTNASAFSLYPNGVAQIDGKNVLTLAASWSDGNSNWYRKYSDGWIEQGGYVAKASAPNATVTFHMPFTNTNYFFTSSATPGSTDASGGDGHQNRTTTGCTILHTAFYHSGAGAYWYACGY